MIPQNKKKRGQIVVELTHAPCKEDGENLSGVVDGYLRRESGISGISGNESPSGAGLLMVTPNSRGCRGGASQQSLRFSAF